MAEPSTNTGDLVNPFAPTASLPEEDVSWGESTHRWDGRDITVNCRATSSSLWMDTVLSVVVDGGEEQSQYSFGWSSHLEFRFWHNMRWVTGKVKPSSGLCAQNMRYELFVDGQRVAKSSTPIRHWHRGVISVPIALGVIYLGFVLVAHFG